MLVHAFLRELTEAIPPAAFTPTTDWTLSLQLRLVLGLPAAAVPAPVAATIAFAAPSAAAMPAAVPAAAPLVAPCLYSKYRKRDLQGLCKECGLNPVGTIEDLRQRLIAFDRDAHVASERAAAEDNVCAAAAAAIAATKEAEEKCSVLLVLVLNEIRQKKLQPNQPKQQQLQKKQEYSKEQPTIQIVFAAAGVNGYEPLNITCDSTLAQKMHWDRTNGHQDSLYAVS